MKTLGYQRSIVGRYFSTLRVGSSFRFLSGIPIIKISFRQLICVGVCRLANLRILLLNCNKVSLSFVRCEGRLRKRKESFNLASKKLFLDLLHALLV
jgi:hypothetical protein